MNNTDNNLAHEHKRLFEKGIRLFNDGLYWDSHEAWEEVWRQESGEMKLFLQGLIQAAAAFHLVFTHPRFSGALRNFEKSRSKLDRFPATMYGTDVGDLTAQMDVVSKEVARIREAGEASVSDALRPHLRHTRT